MSTRTQFAAGPAETRFDPLKQGIHAETQAMFYESPADLAELAAEQHQQYAPADPTERFLADTLIHNEWRLRRMRRVEAVRWEQAGQAFLASQTGKDAGHSGDAFVAGSASFERLQRLVNSCERNFHRALKELQRLPTARPEPTQTKDSIATYESSGSFRKNPDRPIDTTPPTPPNPPATPEAGSTKTAIDEILRAYQRDMAAFDVYFNANRGKFPIRQPSAPLATPTRRPHITEHLPKNSQLRADLGVSAPPRPKYCPSHPHPRTR
jgi:hypothetical protein